MAFHSTEDLDCKLFWLFVIAECPHRGKCVDHTVVVCEHIVQEPEELDRAIRQVITFMTFLYGPTVRNTWKWRGALEPYQQFLLN